MDQLGTNIHESKFYYLTRGWKFIVALAIVSAGIVIGVQAWSLQLPEARPANLCPDEVWIPMTASERLVRFWVITSLMTTLGAASLLLLRAQIRVSTEGISRRSWFRWNTYDWQTLRSLYQPQMCVGQGLPYSNTKLIVRFLTSLQYMNTDDRKEIEQILIPEGTCTHLGNIPNRFHLRLYYSQGELELGSDGLTWIQKDETTNFPWEHVTQLRTQTGTHERADPAAIEFQVAGRQLKAFIRNQPIEPEKPCDCPSEYRLMRFLRAKIDPNRIVEFARQGPPKSIEEAEYRLKDARLLLWMLSSVSGVMLFAWIWMITSQIIKERELAWILAVQIGITGVLMLPVLFSPFVARNELYRPLVEFLERKRAESSSQATT